MDIIFTTLPGYLDSIACVLKRFGHKVFYLKLSGLEYPPEAEGQRALALRDLGIVPLPLEYLLPMGSVRDGLSEHAKFERHVDQLASSELLQSFDDLFPNIANVEGKLNIAIQAMLAEQTFTTDQVNLWAKGNPGRKHLLIFTSTSGILALDLASNVRLLVVPVDSILNGVVAATRFLCKFVQTITTALTHKGIPAVVPLSDLRNVLASRVVFVVHSGLSYANLFKKTLYYSERTNSEMHPNNLLHFDYSGFPSPSEEIRWVCLGSQRQSFLSTLCNAAVAMGRGIVHVRRVREIAGVLFLARVYVNFMAYSRKLEAYPALEVALIDYEVLCPKALLLAFESRNIKTVATQERFIQGFYAGFGFILNTYLCASEYVVQVMRKSLSRNANHYIPVGQYRADNLVAARRSAPPQILDEPIAQGRKLITALGFHTHLKWYNSEADFILNWTAHRHFLQDMIRLSIEIPNVFIVLRFKLVDWVSLPVFADIVQEIRSSRNMTIAVDYEKMFFSYDLCAHSDLVIAKHTSLGDECLSAGIPVLFHEYTHNTERLAADFFDYNPARVLCFSYQDLLERARAVLRGDSAMISDYEYLRNVVFGGLGDGKVRARVHAHIESLLRDDLLGDSIDHSSPVIGNVHSH